MKRLFAITVSLYLMAVSLHGDEVRVELQLVDELITHADDWHCAISFDRKPFRLATSNGSGVSVWDVEERIEVHRLDVADDFEISAIALSPDGKYVATGEGPDPQSRLTPRVYSVNLRDAESRCVDSTVLSSFFQVLSHRLFLIRMVDFWCQVIWIGISTYGIRLRVNRWLVTKALARSSTSRWHRKANFAAYGSTTANFDVLDCDTGAANTSTQRNHNDLTFRRTFRRRDQGCV